MKEIHEVHRPGWSHETSSGVEYIVWAPQPPGGRQKRTAWAASKEGPGELDSEFLRGDTLDDVLVIFPPAIRAKFREVATDGQAP